MCKGPGVERGLGMFVKLSVPSDWFLTQTLLNLSFPWETGVSGPVHTLPILDILHILNPLFSEEQLHPGESCPTGTQ